jgi:hypothetical protein
LFAKNPVFVESGREGARRRWGARRHLDLRELPGPVRAAIEAMAEAEKAAREKAAAAATAATAREGDTDVRHHIDLAS